MHSPTEGPWHTERRTPASCSRGACARASILRWTARVSRVPRLRAAPAEPPRVPAARLAEAAGRVARLVAQVVVESAKHRGLNHPLVHNGARGERCEVRLANLARRRRGARRLRGGGATAWHGGSARALRWFGPRGEATTGKAPHGSNRNINGQRNQWPARRRRCRQGVPARAMPSDVEQRATGPAAACASARRDFGCWWMRALA